MTESGPDGEQDFPDVRTSARTALLVTIGLAAIYGLLFSIFGSAHRTSSIDLIASLGLGAALLLLSYIDLRTGLLLDILTWPLVALGLGYAAHQGSLAWALSGAVVGYVLVAGLALIWRQTRGYEGIGLGDAKLLTAGGAWVGITGLPVILLIASGTGLLMALTVSQKSRSEGDRVAIVFGPNLALGIWVVWCAGMFMVS
ncbi:MAG: A24 family peptidase [Pseudomonadota bacterium]